MKMNFKTFVAALAVAGGSLGAEADTVENYSYDFNTQISTSDHAFRVATGWGHIVDAFTYENPYSGTQTKYQSYSYESTGGVTGGFLKAYGEEIGYTYGGISHTSTDMIVTPKITGTASIYLKGTSSYYQPTAKFYKVSKVGNQLVAGDEITVDMSAVGTASWTKVELPQLDGEYIGIHGSYVGFDDFAVDGSAEVELQKGLTVANVKVADSAPVCNEQNKFSVALTATVSNTGDLALAAGSDGFSLTVTDAAKNELKTVGVGQDLEPGKSANVDIPLEGLDFASTGKSFSLTVTENITGTYAATGSISPVGYAPEMVLENKYGTKIPDGSLQDFGRVNEAKTMSFKIENKGTAPLVITEVNVPEGFTSTLKPQTVAAKQTVDFDISISTESFGDKEGDFVVKAEGVDNVSMKLKGTVLDPEKYLVDFENYEYGGKVPGGITIENGYFKVESWDSSNGNKFVIRNSSSYNVDQFSTPLLEVADGEELSFDVSARYSTSSKLSILYSADREKWTTAKEFSYDEIQTSGYYDLRTVKVGGIPAGKWFVAFKGNDIAIDNIYGFKRIVKDHDLAADGLTVPEKATVNHAAAFKASLKNFNDKVEAADSYSSALYVINGDTAKVTGSAVEIGKEAAAENSFEFTPHKEGKYEAYAEFIFGNDTLRSEKVEFNVEKESADRTATLGEAKTTNSFAPLNLGGGYLSESETVYTADRIKDLKAGDKVTGITIRGTKGSADLTTNLRIYLENTDDDAVDTQTKKLAGDTTKMQKVYDAEYTFKKVGYTAADLLCVSFDKPFEYTGKNIRMRLYSEGKNKTATAYTSFEVDNTDQTHCLVRTVAYSYDEDRYDYVEDESVNARYLPAASLKVFVEPDSLRGSVADGEIGIADIKITLKSDNVEYYGKTDKDGKFAIAVVQSERAYTPVFSADGYMDINAEAVDMSKGSVDVAYNLVKKAVELKGGEWTTVVLPQASFYPEGEYWEMKEYDEAENTLYFNKVESVSDNVPYVFKPEADTVIGNTVYADATEAGTAEVDGFSLKGTYAGKRLATDKDMVCMTLGTDRVFKAVAAEGSEMFTTKAALYVPADKAETLKVVFGKRIVDGIGSVNTEKAADAAVYSIDGTAVGKSADAASLKKGVYIIGKRKVIIK